MADETRTIMTAPAADPAPLGLAAFALTTFLLSAANANWMGSASGDAWLGYAFAYGGLAQLLAGMWEFRNRNVFGPTAFSSYGGGWQGCRLDSAGVRDLQHLHAAVEQHGEHRGVPGVPDPGGDRDRPVHRELRRQREHRQDRWLRGHPDRAVRLVRLGRRGGQRHGRAGPPSGGPAVHQAVFLTKDPQLIPGAGPPPGSAVSSWVA